MHKNDIQSALGGGTLCVGGFSGVFSALLRAARRRAAADERPEVQAALLLTESTEFERFMTALALAFDEAAQAGSVCVRFGALEGALLLADALSRETAEARDEADRDGEAQSAPLDAAALVETYFEGGSLESFPAALRRIKRPTVEAGLRVLKTLSLAGELSALEALSAAKAGAAGAHAQLERAAIRAAASSAAAPFVIDAARGGRIKRRGDIGEAVLRKGRISDREFEASRLYLAREALEELELARRLLQFYLLPQRRLRAESLERVNALAQSLGADELQRKALELALKRRFAVISGGPGTGKTTTVVQILECLFAEKPELRVALAAPTGKAASRMRQSIMQSLASPKLAANLPHVAAVVAADATREPEHQAIRERTIHKWLVSRTSNGRRPSEDNPLEADVLIIDEASMVDIHLAARLLRAVSLETRLIILGDKHQLAAVGPGAVFADISDEGGALGAAVVTLKTSRRFPEDTVIGRLAKAINHELEEIPAPRSGAAADVPEEPSLFDEGEREGDVFEAVKRLFATPADGRYSVTRYDEPFDGASGLSKSAALWLDEKFECYCGALSGYLEAVRRNARPETIELQWRSLWSTLESFRALTAQRRGPMSVEAVNAYFEAKLRDQLLSEGWLDERLDLENWPGRVVIVRRNDDMLGVFNGDIGIVVPERGKDGKFAHVVRFGEVGRRLPPALLPPADTAFAMTIHQSQGSEFEDVAVFLPVNPMSGLATRELLYTGVTRTKRSVAVFGSDAALRRAVETPTSREGGLAERLASGLKKAKKARKSA